MNRTRGLETGEYLRFMHALNRFGGLELDDNGSPDDRIEPDRQVFLRALRVFAFEFPGPTGRASSASASVL